MAELNQPKLSFPIIGFYLSIVFGALAFLAGAGFLVILGIAFTFIVGFTLIGLAAN